jgi:integrase
MIELPIVPAVARTYSEPADSLLEADALSVEAAKAMEAFRREGQSPNTQRTYETALRYWGAWHTLRFGQPIQGPVSPAAVIQFIVDHLEHQPTSEAPQVGPFTPSSRTTQHLLPPSIDRLLVDRGYKGKLGPWTLSTVETRLAALSQAHDAYIARNDHLGLGAEVNPLRDPRVRQLLGAARRAYARRGRTPSRPQAATASILETLVATCGDDLAGIRDRALLYFGFSSGGRRRSEIVAASFENVRRDEDGFIYELNYSKTNRGGRHRPENFKPIQGIAAEALARWISKLMEYRITEGPLFRRVQDDRIHEPLRAAAVRDIVRRRAELSGQALGKLSAHSLRSGFVTEAARQGISLGETMKLTGHRSVQTVMGYYQSGEVAVSRAARLMDRKKGP